MFVRKWRLPPVDGRTPLPPALAWRLMLVKPHIDQPRDRRDAHKTEKRQPRTTVGIPRYIGTADQKGKRRTEKHHQTDDDHLGPALGGRFGLIRCIAFIVVVLMGGIADTRLLSTRVQTTMGEVQAVLSVASVGGHEPEGGSPVSARLLIVALRIPTSRLRYAFTNGPAIHPIGPRPTRKSTTSVICVSAPCSMNSWSCLKEAKGPRIISSVNRWGGSKAVILEVMRHRIPKCRASQLTSPPAPIRPDVTPPTARSFDAAIDSR